MKHKDIDILSHDKKCLWQLILGIIQESDNGRKSDNLYNCNQVSIAEIETRKNSRKKE